MNSSFPYQALLFDLDGLLINNDEVILRVLSQYFKDRFNLNISFERFGHYWQQSRNDLLRAVIAEYNLGVTEAQLWKEASYFLNYQEIELNPGALELLEYARDLGLRLALGASSDKDYTYRKFAHLGIEPFFEVVVSGDDYQDHKPAPDLFLTVAEKLALKPSQILALDDGLSGVAGANKAKMPIIFVPSRFYDGKQKVPGALLLPTLPAVQTYLENLIVPHNE